MKSRPSAEYAVLGTLMPGPKHGYEILQFLNSALESTWQVSPSQLYMLLKRLEQHGMLQSNIKTQETRPSKRVFSLTPTGEKIFLSWLHNPSRHVRDLRIEFLARLFFFHRLSLEGADDLIEAQVQVLKRIMDKIRKREKTERDPYKKLVLSSKIATIDSWLQWLLEQAQPFFSLKKVQANHRNQPS
jgi:DNA-binding PadR family transcriptional regulator